MEKGENKQIVITLPYPEPGMPAICIEKRGGKIVIYSDADLLDLDIVIDHGVGDK